MISKIKKIEIIGLNKDKEALLGFLQNKGKVQLINLKEEKESSISPQKTAKGINLIEIEEAILFLSGFGKRQGFIDSIANIKPVVFRQELKEVVDTFDWEKFLLNLADLRGQIKDLLQRKERLIQRKEMLFPWRGLNLSLNEIAPTKHCGVFLGVITARDYKKLSEEAASQNINFFSESVNKEAANTYLAILYLKKDFEALEAFLKERHFSFITLGHAKGTPKENLLEIDTQLLILDDKISEIKQKLSNVAKEQFKIMLIFDYLNILNERKDADKNLTTEQYSFVLSGFCREKDTDLLEKELTSAFKETAMFISEPKKDEDVPVVLENRKFIQPFEFITQIYGMPKYNEIDPTPFLAPFFFLYFGFCVSDAGYGAILVLASWFVLKKFRLGPTGLRFWRLFLLCGISTIIIGAITGSWFGNLIDLLGKANKIFYPIKRFKDSIILIDPLKEPTKLLGIALGFGIIQVWFGNIVAGIGNIKNRRFAAVLFDQVSMLTFLFGLTGLGMIFLKLLDKTHIGLFKYAIFFGSIALIFSQGRAEKGIGSKLFYGVYNLYNAFSGYLSDILSYSRLWALGLVTGVMANTINLIAIQFSDIMPSAIIGGFVLIAIFIFGHAIALLMNLLGAFVHPLRLQFVEFFSKFFKSGGTSFKPFKIETRYIKIE